MNKIKIFTIAISLAYPYVASAEKPVTHTESCLKAAQTQKEMNSCSGLSFITADKELNRVYKQIIKTYSEDPIFLKRLKKSQLAWIKLKDSDVELHYPQKDKLKNYGNTYSMCATNIKTEITLQRIEFLKQWLIGAKEGDICSGSRKNAWALKAHNSDKHGSKEHKKTLGKD